MAKPPVLSKKEIETILESKWRHNFSKNAMPQLVLALIEAQRDADVKFYEDKLGSMAWMLDDEPIEQELHPVIGTTLGGKPLIERRD